MPVLPRRLLKKPPLPQLYANDHETIRPVNSLTGGPEAELFRKVSFRLPKLLQQSDTLVTNR
jgi:hypothetical protein